MGPGDTDKAPNIHVVFVSLHQVLSRLEWGEGIPLAQMTFLVVDRGSEGDTRKVSQPELVGRDRSYLHLVGGGRIPYHRVMEVRVDGRVVWVREGVDGSGDPQ